MQSGVFLVNAQAAKTFGVRPSVLLDEFGELDALTRWRIDTASSAVLDALEIRAKRMEWKETWGLLFTALLGEKIYEDEADFIDLA